MESGNHPRAKKSLVVRLSPLQELKEGPRSGLHLLVQVINLRVFYNLQRPDLKKGLIANILLYGEVDSKHPFVWRG